MAYSTLAFMPLKKQYPWNVLVFPAASEVALEINRALGPCKEIVLFGANQPGISIADFHFRRLYALPSIHDPACLPALQKLIETQAIDAIFPAYDDVLLWLAQNAGQIGAAIMAPDEAVCALCRSKSATYAMFKNILPVPKLWDTDAADIVFPVFVKPDKGQGSQRARRIDTAVELKQAVAQESDLIIMENLTGEEYTVDCLSQRGRGVLFAQARRRLETKRGIATLTESENLPIAQEWAALIGRHLDIYGAWFFQIKADSKGTFHLLEIAPRIAGSMALSRVTGPNFPLLSLYEAAGHPVEMTPIKAHMMMGRSLDIAFAHDLIIGALYIDLDDTLIIRGEVNVQLVALIFQCRNRAVPVHLITRHKTDPAVTLKKFRLTQLFDRIIHVQDGAASKAASITEKNAVLIDDSFAERQAASQSGVTCFDAAGAACLIDPRY